MLASDFKGWASGPATATTFKGLPGVSHCHGLTHAHALSRAERFAAAAVVLKWAATVPASVWGTGAVAYLKMNGVNDAPVHVPRVGP
jgi:hypothetical protein